MSYFEQSRQILQNTFYSPAAKKYHGLVRQGATCYLNSVLQVLFMTEDFREAVERHTHKNPGTECIDRHLTSLFGDLKRHEAYTHEITNKLGIHRVYEQQDAAEYFERILGLTSPEASQIFHGLLTHKTRCSVCHTGNDADAAFWHLTLSLVDSNSKTYNVVDGIEDYFRTSDFIGEDQMYCDECHAKSDATIKCVIKHHPEVLMLLLKRFEFDYRYMSYVKINCTVDVPYILQIPENETYELYAVVDHFGDIRSGHYTATIKSQDDERWYDFNDSTVTLLHYQPFQVDNFERSNSAYLLFYKKKNVHADDTCTQDIKEVSTPGGFLPAAYECQDVIKMREREEVEGEEEASNEPTVGNFIGRNEETGIRDISGGSREEGPSPNLCNVEDQRGDARHGIPNNIQEYNEERSDLHYQQRAEGKIMTDDEEDMRGNAESDDHAEKREGLFRETQVEESVDDQDDGSADDVRQRAQEGDIIHSASYNNQWHKQETRNMHVRRDFPQQVFVDVQKAEDRMDVNRDKDGEMEGGEQSERKASTKRLEHHDSEGLDDVRQNVYEDQEGTEEAGQDYDRKPVGMNKQGNMEGMEIDFKDRQTRADKRGVASGRGKLLTKYDLCYYDIQSYGRVGDSKQNMPKDDQRSTRGSSSRSFKRHEQPIEEKRDAQGDKEDDKHAQRKGASERQQKDQNNGRLDDDRELNRSEHVTTHKDVGEVKQAKEQERRGDNEHNHSRVDSSLRRAGLSGSRRQGDFQPKARAECMIHEATIEGRHGSKHSKTYHVKIIEEETHGGVQRSSEMKNKKEESVEGTSQDSIMTWVECNQGNVKRKTDPKIDAKVTLSEGVDNLKLNDSPLPKPQKHRTKKMSDAQVHATRNHAIKKRSERKRKLWHALHLKQKGKDKKRHKTSGCFSFFQKSRKNANQTSESD